MNSQTLAVVVSSCDDYSDIWPAFFTLFFRYWPDCPYPVYLVTERQSCGDPRVRHLLVGEDRGWATNLKSALEQIPEQHILYLQEDYLLVRRVDTAKIAEVLAFMVREGASVLRIRPAPPADLAYQDHPEIGEISTDADYRVSLQAAIWDRAGLLSLIREGESGWQMEALGSRRAARTDMRFLGLKLGVTPPVPYLCTAVYRGKWTQPAVELCQTENIPIDTSRRPIRSRWDDYRDRLRRVARAVLRH